MTKKNYYYNVYDEITQQIIEGLKKGLIPWRMEHDSSATLPLNLFTKKFYRGINNFVLLFEQIKKQYSQNLWATFEQIKKLGGHVKKGQKSTRIVFYKMYENNLTIEQAKAKSYSIKNWTEKELEQGFKPYRSSVLKFYSVFNLDQCQVDKEAVKKTIASIESKTFITREDLDKIEKARIIVDGYNGPQIVEGTLPAYIPADDEIEMPPVGNYYSVEGYYGSLFHEFVHSTGAEKRLNRKSLTMGLRDNRSHDYCYEELIAEIGSCFLKAICGIFDKTVENSQAYINGWIKSLQSNPKWIVQASNEAQKAVDYILDGKTVN